MPGNYNKEYMRDWRKRNRQKFNDYQRELYYKRKQKFFTGMKCVNCDNSDWRVLVIDHIIPVSKSGRNTPENIQILCANCHTIKEIQNKQRIRGKIRNRRNHDFHFMKDLTKFKQSIQNG